MKISFVYLVLLLLSVLGPLEVVAIVGGMSCFQQVLLLRRKANARLPNLVNEVVNSNRLVHRLESANKEQSLDEEGAQEDEQDSKERKEGVLLVADATQERAVTMAGSKATAHSLSYLQRLAAGALSRSIAQTIMHPMATYKTMLQMRRTSRAVAKLQLTPSRLIRGLDAQFVMSLPHGALYFYVVGEMKKRINKYVPTRLNFLGDFAASTVSTIVCSVVSTPQMVLTDRLMAGLYPSFPSAVSAIIREEGVSGFYVGWWPALAQKIPSYGLTWMFFQQMKRLHQTVLGFPPLPRTSFMLGALAAGAAVCVMNPVDTVKTRLVTQMASCVNPYTSMSDCFLRILREEGIGAFYTSLPPRLMGVVPMIAIQFGVYDTLKKHFEASNRKYQLDLQEESKCINSATFLPPLAFISPLPLSSIG